MVRLKPQSDDQIRISTRGAMSVLSHSLPRERAKRCREFAQSARLSATTATGELRDAYLKLAGQWEQLSHEATKEAR
jgi:hypothetical protein